MRIAVTGGGGFIGAYLVEHLLRLGHEVLVIDNFSSGSVDNLRDLSSLKVFRLDISRPDGLGYVLRDVEYVFHLAAVAGVPACEANHDIAFASNVVGTYNIAEASLACGVKGIIFSSSAAVYGDIRSAAVEEQECRPVSFYGYSKLVSEKVLEEYSRLYGLRCIVLRLFNVYGLERNGRFRDDVISAFLKAASNKQKLKIYGSGNQTRDFVHISDVIQGFEAALRNISSSSSFDIFNIASGKPVSIYELARLVLDAYGLGLDMVEMLPPREGDIGFSAARIDKASSLLGFWPKVELKRWLFEFPQQTRGSGMDGSRCQDI
ncbi:MAG: NAD-dependent epimerase/dehydratase family protein [Aigarchaeota archaeon]|nr:NAD-dependent epimerase/dehydratase family protein [Candidatus Pelearchaeum maunauluense]